MGDVVLTLFRLTYVATIMTVALEQIFDTRFYQKYFGKGENGEGSRFFTNFELRPWIAAAVGVFLAFGFKFRALESGLGDVDGSGTFLGNEAATVDMFLTGVIIGGGTKTIKKIAKMFSSAQAEINTIKNPPAS